MYAKIDNNNVFGIQDDLLDGESRSHLTCPNCEFHTVIKVFNPDDFNYPEWNSKAKFQNMNSKEHVKLRIPNAITLSKQLHIHPTRVFNELVSCYWSAWDWGACEQIAINNLQTKCLNCSYDLEYLRITNES